MIKQPSASSHTHSSMNAADLRSKAQRSHTHTHALILYLQQCGWCKSTYVLVLNWCGMLMLNLCANCSVSGS